MEIFIQVFVRLFHSIFHCFEEATEWRCSAVTEPMVLLKLCLVTFVLLALSFTPVPVLWFSCLQLLNELLMMMVMLLQDLFPVVNRFHLMLNSLLLFLNSLDVLMHMSHSLGKASFCSLDGFNLVLEVLFVMSQSVQLCLKTVELAHKSENGDHQYQNNESRRLLKLPNELVVSSLTLLAIVLWFLLEFLHF